MCRYQLPADHYLRDGVPTMTGPGGWQKGRITFGIDGGIARKGTAWEINRVAIIPQNNCRYPLSLAEHKTCSEAKNNPVHQNSIAALKTLFLFWCCPFAADSQGC